MLGPSGKPFQSVTESLADVHGVCGFVAFIQFGILAEDFRLCCHPISWLAEIQFLAIGNVLDSIMHLCLNLFAILASSLVHAGDFVRVNATQS